VLVFSVEDTYPSPFSLMTALFESLPPMVICDVYSVLILTYLHFSQVRKPVLDITFNNAAVYTHSSKLEGSECFKLQISNPKVTSHSTTSKTPVNMSSIPKDYHDFTDMLSKSMALTDGIIPSAQL